MEHDDMIGDRTTEYLRGVQDCAGYLRHLFYLKVTSDPEARRQLEKICEEVQGILTVRFRDSLDLESGRGATVGAGGVMIDGNAKAAPKEA